MLFKSSKVHIQFMQVLKKCTQRSALGHHGEGVDILREALATIAELAIRSGNVSMSVVDVA